ncbi:MAG: hypothetical protein IPH69_02125 [Bacteroidales bacterium]|nr:hypothetical protein [Bacteroidales bacterium]
MKKKAETIKAENIRKTFYRTRKAIGWLGILLSFILLLLSLIPFFKTAIQPSISHYYYTNLREIFTGVLCATSLFLISYRGYSNEIFCLNENIMTNIAGFLALGVALMPTNPVKVNGEINWVDKIDTLLPVYESWTGTLHYIFAAGFFFILAHISHNIFVLGQIEIKGKTTQPYNENRIYRICGWVIFIAILLIPAGKFLIGEYSTLPLEAVALVAFGISWLTKGRIFEVTKAAGKAVYMENRKENKKP